ncbi:tRNA uridin [Sesbania bispinosa]|nr:tRNA uridin [Sesbania bispinosa]
MVKLECSVVWRRKLANDYGRNDDGGAWKFGLERRRIWPGTLTKAATKAHRDGQQREEGKREVDAHRCSHECARREGLV